MADVKFSSDFPFFLYSSPSGIFVPFSGEVWGEVVAFHSCVVWKYSVFRTSS